MYFCSFQGSSYYWFLVLLHCDQQRYLIEFLLFWICADMFCGLRYGLFWRMIHVLKKKMCILQRMDKMFYRYQLVLIGLVWSLTPIFFSFFLFSFLFGLSIHYWEWVVEISYYYCIAVYFSLYIHSCLLHIIGSSGVGCIFIIVTSSGWTDHFMITEWLCFFLQSLICSLSDVSILMFFFGF